MELELVEVRLESERAVGDTRENIGFGYDGHGRNYRIFCRELVGDNLYARNSFERLILASEIFNYFFDDTRNSLLDTLICFFR